ncbi:Calreticulin family protein [Aphelenchoides bicaudatus]|nr:Calreticulin family protein [Aphelenchoides bicaudatus]
MGPKRSLLYVSLLLLCVSSVSANDPEEEVESEPSGPEFKPTHFVEPNLDLSGVYFVDFLNDPKAIGKTWKTSTAKKEGLEESLAKYDGQWAINLPTKVVMEDDYGLVARSKARHHAIAVAVPKPIDFTTDELVVQYEVKYEDGQECGGGYLKLLSSGAEKNIQSFADKTEYTIMFGPDKCGTQSKVHFIIKLKNPKNGTVSEHHAPQPKNIPEFADRKSHLFTLKLRKDNSYEVQVDMNTLYSGNMLNDLVPSSQPPTQIADPSDKKPADWSEEEYMDDKTATKPEDWDENAPAEILDEDATKPSDWLEEEELLVPDPEAEKPADWDDDMDGFWEPKMINNPKCEGRSGCGAWKKPMKANPNYKGKWTPPRIKNPDYKGKWSARLIDNPNYFEANPYSQLEKVTALGFELWTMSQNILFDNIFIGNSAELAADFATQTFKVKNGLEAQLELSENPSRNVFQMLVDATEERPWLWAVYVLCVLIPCIALGAYFFGRKTPAPDHPKKTDEYQPDDEEELLDENDAEELDDQPGPSSRHSSRRASQVSNKSSGKE